jgi:hypothetical protein
MKKLFLLAAVTIAAAATPAKAAILFDPTGGGCATTCYVIDLFDPTTGNAISIGLSAGSTVGSTGTLLYQANLGIASLSGVQQYANGSDGNFFTFAAEFEEVVTASVLVPGVTSFLAFGPDTTTDTGGTFNMFQHDGAGGDNLSGTCFVSDCGGTLILSGTFINDPTTFFGTFSANLAATPGALDQFNANDYAGLTTVSGNGGFNARILITGVDPLYFPSLSIGDSFIIATSQQSLPYEQADPSFCFSLNGFIACTQPGAQLASIGLINGLSGPNTMLQTDASLAFIAQDVIPEPATLTLLGIGLLGSAAARRRMRRN